MTRFAQATLTMSIVGACALAACSSDTSTSSNGIVDGGSGDASADGSSTLPSCLTSGFQCQPKGCNAGYEPLGAYQCETANSSCCGKSVSPLDASADVVDAAKISDATSE